MGTEVVNYDEVLASMAKQATEQERPSASTIGLKSGILTYMGNPVPNNKLDCIVIASTHTNLYYEGRFDPNNPTSPLCYAYGDEEEDLAPHPTASKPQAESCAVCPHNKWGSDPDGGRGKACKNSRSLAIIPADTKPEEVAECEVAIMKLPVTSVKNWAAYIHKVATLYSRPPLGLVTTIGTVPDAKSQFKVTFQNGELVDNSMLAPLLARVETIRPLLERVYEPDAEPTPESGKKQKF